MHRFALFALALGFAIPHIASAAEKELTPIEQEFLAGCSQLKESAFGTEQENKRKQLLKALFCHDTIVTKGDRKVRLHKSVREHESRDSFDRVGYKFDETYLHSQLDLLRIALNFGSREAYYNDRGSRPIDETIMLNDRRVDWALAYSARRQIDDKLLAEEMKAAGFGGPLYAAEVKRWFGILDEKLKKVDEAAKAAAVRSPTLAATFKDAVSAVSFYRSQGEKFSKELAQQNDVLTRVRAGKKLDAKECDTPMLKSYLKLRKVKNPFGVEPPLAVRARVIAAACARIREDQGATTVYESLSRSGRLGMQPFTGMGAYLRERSAKVKEELGEAIDFEANVRIRRDFSKAAKIRETGEPDSDIGEPRDGAVKITQLLPVRYRGTDYILAKGKPSKTQVTVGVGCKDVKTGAWKWRQNTLRPEVVSKCKSFKKKTVDVRYQRVLVPKALAGGLKKGKWHRFHSATGLTITEHTVKEFTPQLDFRKDLGEETSKVATPKIGVPICRASKASKCSPGEFDPTREDFLLN